MRRTTKIQFSGEQLNRKYLSLSVFMSSCFCIVRSFQFSTNVVRPPVKPTLSFENYLNFYKDKETLVVGDGDFAFSGDLSSFKLCKRLVSTTIDSKVTLRVKYGASNSHIQRVEQNGDEIMYEIDATKLSFPDKFDIITWNFPHRIGKQNNRYNRQLLKDFLTSTHSVLKEDGQIFMSLLEKQSGTQSTSKIDWDYSWQLPIQVAESGLLLTQEWDFNFIWPTYQPTGKRGWGKSFPVDKPKLFEIRKPNLSQKDVVAYQAPMFTFEVPLISSSLINLNDLFPNAIEEVTKLLKEHSYEDYLWSVNIVECYPEFKEIVYKVEVCLLSLTLPINREKADAIRDIIQDHLPGRLKLA
jgi:hypothetical protein